MISTFGGLGIAVRGLYSSQIGLAVTTNNISNENTAGYSRQTVNQTTTGSTKLNGGSVIVGGGSVVISIDRTRDGQLDKKYWRQNSALGEWEVKSDALTEIETLIGETSEFSTVMDDFYAALEDLSNNAGDSSVRTVVMETAKSVCSYLNDTAEQLQELRADLNTSVKTTVDQLNSYVKQIAALNAQIAQASVNGSSTNDLADARDLLIDQLSGLAKVSVSETTIGTGINGSANTMLTISINGTTIVSGGSSRQLECYENGDGMYSIRWADTQTEFEPGSGTLQGYLDIRDGAGVGADYQGIPYYLDQLDEFARTFAEAFNEGVYKDGSTSEYSGHAAGYGSDGSTGIRFFTYDDLSSDDFGASGTDLDSRYANITAANISVALDIQEDVGKIAASSSADAADNNENISDLISLCSDSAMFAKGTPEDFMNSILATLGTESAYAQTRYDLKSTIVNNIDERRSSVSGVSDNEETANYTKYQMAYNASAQMVTMWNEIYQTTINMVNS